MALKQAHSLTPLGAEFPTFTASASRRVDGQDRTLMTVPVLISRDHDYGADSVKSSLAFVRNAGWWQYSANPPGWPGSVRDDSGYAAKNGPRSSN